MFYQPMTVEEALRLKAQLGSTARFLAGGTDVVVMLKKGRLELESIIDLGRLDSLGQVREEGDRTFVGATRRHRQLEDHPVAALAQAARTVGGPQIRNRGTIGGNVGTASPAGDVSVALLALDAYVELVSERGVRELPLSAFFLGVGKTAIAPDELIMGFRFLTPARSGFLKLGKRNAVAIAVVSAAASLSPRGEVRLALGSVAPTPLRLHETEAFLAKEGLSAASIEVAADLARREARPITDHRASAEYRRDVSGVLVKRILAQLLEGAAHA